MKKIEDLSYSGLVDLIQGDEKVAGEAITAIAFEYEQLGKDIAQQEEKLRRMKDHRACLLEGTKRVMKHINMQYPLAVQGKGFIVVLTESGVTVERNVI